jgi:hypothetical protein
MLYWSMLVYDYEEVAESPYSLEAGMALYALEQFELLWERSLDTKAIMAWSSDTVVLAFRGTASLANVIADLQARHAWHHWSQRHVACGLSYLAHRYMTST